MTIRRKHRKGKQVPGHHEESSLTVLQGDDKVPRGDIFPEGSRESLHLASCTVPKGPRDGQAKDS